MYIINIKVLRVPAILLVAIACGRNTNSIHNEVTEVVGASNDSLTLKTLTVNDSNKIIKILKDSLLLCTDTISKNSWSMKVETYYYKDDAWFINSHIDKVVLKQILSFSYKDSIFCRLKFPVWKLRIVTSKNRKIKIQENNIFEISILIGKRDWLYQVSGGGELDSQTEYYGLFSKRGKLLRYSYTSWQNYISYQKNNKPISGIPDESWGDIDKVLIKFGISEEESYHPTKVKEVFF